jgi:hypothetical protein
MGNPAGRRSVPRRAAPREVDAPPVARKVMLRNRAGQTESIWCTVVDATKGIFRVDNIPVLVARPRYGDEVVATPSRKGDLTFRRVYKDGGYWSDILEYTRKATYRPLSRWLYETHGIIAEGYLVPEGATPGLMLITIPGKTDYGAVGEAMEARFPGVRPHNARSSARSAR